MAAPLKVSTLVTIDATQAKAGGAEAQRAISGMGDAADIASTKVQQLINRSAGIGGGAANQNIREWTGALAMQGRSIDELRAKYNPLFAVINQYKSSLTEIRTLHAQGVLSTNEMTAAISRQRQATLASIDAIKGRNQAMIAGGDVAIGSGPRGFETANIAAQFQDIGVTAAMGMNPLMIALQQGTQLSSVIGTMERPVAGLLSAFRAMVSPVSLVTIGLTAAAAAAIQYFMSASQETDEANKALEGHAELIRRLKDAYGEAAKGAEEYGKESRKLLNQDAEDQRRAQVSLLNSTANDIVTEVMSVPIGDFQGQTYLIEILRTAVSDLQGSIAAGSPDIQKFVEQLVDIEKRTSAPERIRELASSLRQAAKDGIEAQRALSGLMQVTNQVGANQRGALLGSTAETDRNSYLDAERLSLRRMRDEAAARSASLMARTAEERAAAARQAEAARFVPGESSAERNLRIEIAEKQTLLQIDRERIDAARERQRSIDETIAGQRLELSLIGQTTSAIEAQRMEARLLAEAKADAERNGTTVSDEEIQKIREASAEYGRLAEAIEATNALRGQRQDIDQLQLEISLVGQREDVRRRALALAEAEQEIRDRGMSGDLAEEFRRGAVEAENYRMRLEQVQDAWGSVQSAGENAIDSLVEGLASGDIEGTLESVAKDITKTVLQLGVANPLKNAMFGTNYGTLSDVGSIFSNLTGGGATGTGLGSSVGSMNVNAASVTINGGVPGSGLFGQGISGLAANQNMPGSMSAYAAAIRKIESSGNYQALGPVTSSGDRAYGAYQVMGANIPSWTKGALGQSLSPQQFLSSSSAQDAVFNKYFGQSLAKYGNANDAASVWFTGRPLAQGGNASDILGTTGKAYVDKFNTALGQVTNTAGAANQNLGAFGNNLGGLGSALQNASSGLGSGGSSSGGIFGSLAKLFGFGGGGGSQWAAAASGSIVGLFDSGGYTGHGGRLQPAGVVHKGEVVWSQDDVARAGGWQTVEAMRLGRRGYAGGGAVGMSAANANISGPKSSIVVNNYSNARVETEEQTDERGNRQTVFTLSEAVGEALSTKGGRANKTMTSQYGVRKQGRRR
ncbi:MAG: phage tail length tape measure family protein [Allorhizobium sp.]